MDIRTKNLLVQQGYTEKNITECKSIDILARWTPFACAIFGITGLLLKSPYYFWALGLLTSIGAISSNSFFDYLYKIFIRKLFKTNDIPKHGSPRRFGCAIGAVIYLVSGTGFFLDNPYLAYIPSLFIVMAALLAGLTQWCFASAIYNHIFKTNQKCC
jgi:hypothetical protein